MEDGRIFRLSESYVKKNYGEKIFQNWDLFNNWFLFSAFILTGLEKTAPIRQNVMMGTFILLKKKKKKYVIIILIKFSSV